MTKNAKVDPRTVRACVNCVNMRVEGDKLVCGLEIAMDKFDLVRGFQPQLSAYFVRSPKGACGPDANLFEPMAAPAMAEQVEAVRVRYGAVVATRAKEGALAVLAMPGNVVAGVASGVKARLGRFSAKVARARAAWSSIEDNSAPKLLTADPIAEAEAVAAGQGPVVNQEAMLEAVGDANVRALREASARMARVEENATATVEEKVTAIMAPDSAPVPLAVPADPASERKVANAVAVALAMVLVGYVAAGMVFAASQSASATDRVFGDYRNTCCDKGNPSRCWPCRPDRPSAPVMLDKLPVSSFYRC